MKDPVCGMHILLSDAVGQVTHRGRAHYFCSQSCVDKFRTSPDTYVNTKPAESRPPTSGDPRERTWTCPMHPEIVRDEPGSCPICGMALEPRVVTLAPGLCPASFRMKKNELTNRG